MDVNTEGDQSAVAPPKAVPDAVLSAIAEHVPSSVQDFARGTSLEVVHPPVVIITVLSHTNWCALLSVLNFSATQSLDCSSAAAVAGSASACDDTREKLGKLFEACHSEVAGLVRNAELARRSALNATLVIALGMHRVQQSQLFTTWLKSSGLGLYNTDGSKRYEGAQTEARNVMKFMKTSSTALMAACGANGSAAVFTGSRLLALGSALAFLCDHTQRQHMLTLVDSLCPPTPVTVDVPTTDSPSGTIITTEAELSLPALLQTSVFAVGASTVLSGIHSNAVTLEQAAADGIHNVTFLERLIIGDNSTTATRAAKAAAKAVVATASSTRPQPDSWKRVVLLTLCAWCH